MRRKHIWSTGGTAIILLIAVLYSPALAQLIQINVDLQGGESGSTAGHATVYADIDWDDVTANPDETYTWWMPDPLAVAAENDPTNILGIIDGVSLAIKADPIVNLGFAVTAGDYTTAFSFSSTVLAFDPLTNPQALALASVTVGNGDTLTGGYDFKAYRSLYNGSNIFADLVDTPVGWPGGSESSGWQQISGTVSSIQAKWQFTLTADGSASGTANYEVVPEPSTIILLGMGGLVLLRRRNRK